MLKRAFKRPSLVPKLKSGGMVRKPTKLRATGRIKPKKGKEKTISKLIKELDAVFSKYVRYSRVDSNGMVMCFTCDKYFDPKKIHNGHYVSRFYKSVRWSEDNCRPQCMWCNMFKNGDAANYRERLVEDIGEPAVLYLEQSRHVSQKLDPNFLKERIQHYQEASTLAISRLR